MTPKRRQHGPKMVPTWTQHGPKLTTWSPEAARKWWPDGACMWWPIAARLPDLKLDVGDHVEVQKYEEEGEWR